MGDERGFTLVEVLVVMTVLAVAVLGFLQATLLAARLEERARALVEGSFLAGEGLERVGALGWERATAGLERGALPELLGTADEVPQERVSRAGLEFLRVYRNAAAADGSARCAVHCFWRRGGGAFDRRNGVRLAGRGER